MRLDPIFADNAVFAANREISIFGSGAGKAMLKFNGYEKEIRSDGDRWCIKLPKMPYGGPYALEFSSEEETKVVEGIYIGEVILFAGQSNINFSLKASNTPREYYADDFPALHYIKVTGDTSFDRWVTATEETAEPFSALGYIAGKECAKRAGVAIGIICCTLGASVIESWMPEGALDAIGIHLRDKEKFHDHKTYGQWNSDGFLYNQRLSHVFPYTLSGVVWYQGESDASPAEGALYCRELSELIRIWRRDFQDPALPFVVVQLADTAERIALDEGWRLVQEAQMEISRCVPEVYTVISRDISETDDIHPPSKYALALRITDAIIKHFF